MNLRKKRLIIMLVLSILMVSIGFTSGTVRVNASVMEEVVFIDNSIQDYQVLVDSIPASLKVVILDGTKDGVYQIADYLKDQYNVDAIHIISHGSIGKKYIGTGILNVKTLESYSEQLTIIRQSLTKTGDILLYGCNVALGEEGKRFIEEVADITGADVIASDNETGASSLDGDWVLELTTGEVERNTLVFKDYNHILGSQYTSISSPFNDARLYYSDSSSVINIDYDNDGDQDVLTGNTNNDYTFYKNNGSGSFSQDVTPNATFPITNAYGFLVVDLDNDGDEDIIAPNGTGSDAYLFENDGSGIFTQSTNPITGAHLFYSGQRACVNIDYDSDGDQDILASKSDDSAYVFFKNDGSGNFTEVAPNVTFPLKNATDYLVFDLDNDGDEDIIAPNGAGSDAYLFENDGSGIFTQSTNPITGAHLFYVGNRVCINIDYDSDGDQDILAYKSDDSTYVFFKNDGSGNFTEVAPNVTFSLNNAYDYLVFDLDNDGDEDIIGPNGIGLYDGLYFTQDGTVVGTDNKPPKISSTNPVDDAVDVSGGNDIVLTFDENILSAGSESIHIYRASDNQLIESIFGNDAKITGVGSSTITINPTTTLSDNTSYYILIDKKTFFDEDGMSFMGITDKMDLNFTTGSSATYTITYDGNGNDGGSVPTDSNSYLENAEVAVLGNTGTLIKTGSTFAGWNTQVDGNGTDYAENAIFNMGTSNIILYAKWIVNPTYTVTYNGNGNTGGSVPTDSNSYEQGVSVTVFGNTGTLIKTGSTFAGWNTGADGNGTDYVENATFNMGTSNIILYAKWTLNPTYTVTYNGNGNTGGNVPTDSNTYEQAINVTVLGNTGTLVKTGSTFAGWNTQSDGNGIDYAANETFNMGTSDVILYAKWTLNPTYTVTYNGNGNIGGSVPTDSNSYEQGVSVTVAGNTGTLIKTGSTFAGWNTQADGNGIDYVANETFNMGSTDVTLYAKWTLNPTYTVTYNGNENTGGSVPIDVNTYEQGVNVTVLGNTGTLIKTGSTFAGWNTQADGNGTDYVGNVIFDMGTANVTLYAKWTVNPTYTVTYNGNGNTGGSVPTDSNTYEQGVNVIVAGNTGTLIKTGSTFAGWNTGADGNGTDYAENATFNMGTSNITLYAKWTVNPTYTVTYKGNENTGGSVPIDVNTYEQGVNVTVLGNTGTLIKTGSTFAGWNTQADGNGTDYVGNVIFDMGTSNITLYAKWTLNPTYTVTYNDNGSTGGSAPIDVNTYEQGVNVTVLGNTGTLIKTGSTFAGWNTGADGNGTNYVANATFNMGTSNITLYAKWTLNPINPTVTAIAVKTAPTKITYTEGDKLDLTGLVVTLTKSDSTSEDVNFADFGTKGITTNPANRTTLGTSFEEVTIIHTESSNISKQVITVKEKVATPIVIPNGGSFTGSTQVTLASTTTGASIYFTLDGSETTTNSIIYVSPITINQTTTIKVMATKTGYVDSDVLTVTFTKYSNSSKSNSGSSSNSNNNIVNGKADDTSFDAGTKKTTYNSEGKKETTVTVKESAIKKQVEKVAVGEKISIPVEGNADVAKGKFTVQSVKDMQEKDLILEVKTDKVTYELPTGVIDVKVISDKIGDEVALQNIEFMVKISKTSNEMVKIVENSADKGELAIVVAPVDFEIEASYKDKSYKVDKFNTFVTRTIEIPSNVDASKITTAIVIEDDGRIRHIPTCVTKIDGKYYATINSLTNSTYTLIYNEVTFSDVTDSHWAKADIEKMASRLVVEGKEDGTFSPDESITRAELAQILVKTLGIKPVDVEKFYDVESGTEYAGYIGTAYSYDLIKGTSETTFNPEDFITRQDAMTMIYRAGMIVNSFDKNHIIDMTDYVDYKDVSDYAKDAVVWNVENGIIVGKTDTKLNSHDNITRAELSAVTNRFLKSAGLIE